jgi:ABC-type uncharacterized transport system substrate-binding protein
VNRRELATIVVHAAAASSFLRPAVALAQVGQTMRRIGYLRAAPPPEHEFEIVLRALAAHGYVQGRNFLLLPQWGDGNVSGLPELAVALVNLGVDVILVEGFVAARAAHGATRTIPIVVMRSADPFLGGLVQSLSHPGGNVTGFTSQSTETNSKSLEILKELVPGLERTAMLAARQLWDLFAPATDQAARALGMKVNYVDLDVSEPDAIDAAVRQALAAGAQGAIVRGSPFFSSAQRRTIINSAAKHRLPVMYERREFVEQGGLLSHAPETADQLRRAAGYIARILAGASAAELPVQLPTRFELVINVTTAKSLALPVPRSLLALADEVIE